MNNSEFRGKSFEETAVEYGENAAIEAGIEADPDTLELNEAWFDKARPASEVVPTIVERYQDTQRKKRIGKKVMLPIPLDADLAERIRSFGHDWEQVVNDELRRAFSRS